MFAGDVRWNTWSGDQPLTMTHLPTGLGVFLGVFTSADERYRLLGTGPVELREHALGGTYVSAVAHAGESAFDVRFARRTSDELVLRVAPITLGSWGLRVWLSVELAFTDVRSGPDRFGIEGAEIRQADEQGLLACHRSTYVQCLSTVPPVHRQFFDSRDELPRLLEERGYYASHADAGEGPVGVLRYTFQTHPEVTVALASGNDARSAHDAALTLRENADEVLATVRESVAISRPASAAVRDVVGWNTVWDSANHRVTTTASRSWLSHKFGGWGVWFTDALWHAILCAASGDASSARANLHAALDAQTPTGMYPGLRTQHQEWVDRSQPPMAAYAIWRVRSLLGDDSIVRELYDSVLRNHEWWFHVRGRGSDQLIEYGSSDAGAGAFRHTKQAAMDESSMDNLPQFDPAVFDQSTHSLDLVEPGLNSLIVLEGQMLAEMADLLGRPDGPRLRARAEALGRRVHDELWDPQRQVFAARRRDGSFVESLAATCFYPLVAGIADSAQADALVDHYLFAPEKFGGPRLLPVSSHDDPASIDNVYWRGRIWPPVLFLVWEGLRRADRLVDASRVADAAWELFDEGWATHRACRENYHRHSADGDATADSDGFYTWGALLPLVRELDEADCSPWTGGLTFAPREGAEPVSIVESLTCWRARHRDQTIIIERDGDEYLRAKHCTSVAIHPTTDRVRVTVLLTAGPSEVVFAGIPSERVRGAWLRQVDRGWAVINWAEDASTPGPAVLLHGPAGLSAEVDLVLSPSDL